MNALTFLGLFFIAAGAVKLALGSYVLWEQKHGKK